LIQKASIRVTGKVGEALRLTLATVGKGSTKANMTIIDSTGASVEVLKNSKVTKGSSFSTPALKFLTQGIYKVSLSVGKNKYTITVRID
jgi:hypothetical protein